ncbi:MAG: hypothetical protein IT365_09945 [Candidatus Hydrogenedentes bacterium]|nr:hypothetical protein [Candidatus Hydrogenedentota bacterium]
MSSIRGQLIRGMAKGLVIILLVSEAILYMGVRTALTRQFDETLLAKARAFAALSNQTGEDVDGRLVAITSLPPPVRDAIRRAAGEASIPEVEEVVKERNLYYKVECIRDGVESEFLVAASGEYMGPIDEYGFAVHDAAMPEFQPSATPEYYQVWDEDGEAIAKSPSLESATLPWSRAQSSAPAYQSITLPDGRNGRMVTLPFRPRRADFGNTGGGEEFLLLAVARSRRELDTVLHILLCGLFATGILLSAGAALVVRATVKSGLVPLDALGQQATAIDAANLNIRFPTARLPEELIPISTRLNELLERLEAAFSRERRFTSDVAHELRTPIAELRALAEVELRSQTGNGAPYLHDALAIATQMERLVAALLTLARCESSQLTVIREPVDLVTALKEAWRPLAEKCEKRLLHVRFDLPPEAVVETDRALLLAILTNTLSNAVAYTPSGGNVTVEIMGADSAPILRISNTNAQLRKADLSHLAEPFWRKDTARSDTSHSGVGLAVVAALVDLLELDLALDLPSSDLFCLSISGFHTLPITQPE